MVSDGRNGPIAIRGFSVTDPNKPPTRLELRDLRKTQPDQWNLFLLGMERLKNVKEDDPLSYYQIAGIHGQPYNKKWPDQKWNNEFAEQQKGYCTHTSILFLPWHRPYLSLFETTLYKHINDIANEFKDNENKARYIQAAKTFRLPYWDWARPVDSDVTLFPWEVVSDTKHKVYRPGKGSSPIPMDYNPLATYKFQDEGEGQKNPQVDLFPIPHQTLRYPDHNKTSTDAKVTSKLAAFFAGTDGSFNKPVKGLNLTERALFILQAYEEFPPMSSNSIPGGTGTNGQWTGWGSLEDIHNSVHDYVGGGGHMNYPSTSSFDPIFWLHHCNIDRLFAIWQALHDDGEKLDYVVPTKTKSGTRTIPINTPNKKTGKLEPTMETITTGLSPFTKSETAGDYWTSEGVRKPETFGYTYPEIVSRNKDDIYKKLNAIYPGASLAVAALQPESVKTKLVAEFSARAATHQIVTAAMDLEVPLVVQPTAVSQVPVIADDEAKKLQSIKISLPKDRDFSDLIVDNKYLEWLVDIRAFKYANNGDFVVHFFLGPTEDDTPNLYIFHPNHLATFSTFGQDADAGCVQCKENRDAGLNVAGQIPLTLALVERYIAGPTPNSLGVSDIEDYLARNLHWRVTTVAGEPLPRNSIQDLLVGVVTNEVTLPSDPSGRPSYAPGVVARPRATTNQAGDAGRGDGTGYTGGSLT